MPIGQGENLGTLTNGEVNGQYAGTFIERYYNGDARLQEAAGTRAIYQTANGLPMLIYQAIFALEYFLDRPLPRHELAQVVFAKLGLV